MSAETLKNPYLPKPVTVRKITIENDARDLKTFQFAFCDEQDRRDFAFTCGQFAMLSVPGAGESPIGIASSPLDDAFVEFTVKRYPTGVLTTALHDLEEGGRAGLRGPFGNTYPMKELEGKNVVIVGGGFAFTTLRSTIKYMLHEDNRPRYGKITVIYGARSPGELLYKTELKEWEARDDVDVFVTVDRRDESWTGREGFVPTAVDEVAPDSENAIALVCGPPLMIKFTIPPLLKLGFSPDRVITSLERRMTCGVGKCGRCNIGGKYVCKDGPVFSLAELQKLPESAL